MTCAEPSPRARGWSPSPVACAAPCATRGSFGPVRSIESTTLPPVPQVSRSPRWVGCSLPEPWVGGDRWHPVDATVFTERTRRRMARCVANAQAARAIDDTMPITIRATSDFVEVQPPLHTGLRLTDDYLEARFFARHKRPDTPPVVCFEFMSGDIAVPFGTLHVVLSTGSVETQAPTCCVLSCPEDRYGVAERIETALLLGGAELVAVGVADRVILVVSDFSRYFVEDHAAELRAAAPRIAVAYTSTAALRALPAWLRDQPSRFYSNNLAALAEQVERVAGNVRENTALLQQCLEVLHANHRAICDAAGNVCPTQLQIWPAERPRGVHRLDPRNWALHKYRLHLLCEGCADCPGGRPAHFNFDRHPGYTISVPKKWFQRWGKFVLLSIKILCVTAKVAASAGGLAHLIPSDFGVDVVNQALPLLNIAAEDLAGATLADAVQAKAGEVLGDLDAALEEDGSMAADNAEVALTWLESFLETAEPVDPKLAGLRRCFRPMGTPNAGQAAWVCAECASVMNRSARLPSVRTTMV